MSLDVSLSMIWAQSLARPNRPPIIGRDGALPWHLPEDAARFRELTYGHPVIMGRATWDSLPARFRPLPGRTNIVLTRSPGWTAPGADTAGSPADALGLTGRRPAWVIGGTQVYSAFLELAESVAVTEVDIDLGGPRDGDALAPSLDESWRRVEGSWQLSSKGLAYRYVSATRIAPS